jgi:hypothetical protein
MRAKKKKTSKSKCLEFPGMFSSDSMVHYNIPPRSLLLAYLIVYSPELPFLLQVSL